MTELIPFAWRVPAADSCGTGCEIYRCEQRAGPDLYAVRRGGYCLSAAGEWHYEPMPSSRTDEFLAAHRFPTLAAATEAAVRAEAVILEWLAAHPEV